MSKYTDYFKFKGSKIDGKTIYEVYQPYGYPLILKKNHRVLASIQVFFDDEPIEHQKYPIPVPHDGGFQIIFQSDDLLDKGRPIKYILTNHCKETGYVKIDLGFNNIPSCVTDPPENINNINEIRSFECVEIKSNQNDSWKELIIKTKQKINSDGSTSFIELKDETNSSTKLGSYLYLTVTPQNDPIMSELFKDACWCTDELIIVEKNNNTIFYFGDQPFGTYTPANPIARQPLGTFTSANATAPAPFGYTQAPIATAPAPTPSNPFMNPYNSQFLQPKSVNEISKGGHTSYRGVGINHDNKKPILRRGPTNSVNEMCKSIKQNINQIYEAGEKIHEDINMDNNKKSILQRGLSQGKGLFKGLFQKKDNATNVSETIDYGSSVSSDSNIMRGGTFGSDEEWGDFDEKCKITDKNNVNIDKSKVAEMIGGDRIIKQHGNTTNAKYDYTVRTKPQRIGLSIMDLGIIKVYTEFSDEDIKNLINSYFEDIKNSENIELVKIANSIKKYKQDDCTVCLDSSTSILLVRCGHICTCSIECTEILKNKCPICRSNILCKIDEKIFNSKC
jgi:hypothetical protein